MSFLLDMEKSDMLLEWIIYDSKSFFFFFITENFIFDTVLELQEIAMNHFINDGQKAAENEKVWVCLPPTPTCYPLCFKCSKAFSMSYIRDDNCWCFSETKTTPLRPKNTNLQKHTHTFYPLSFL